VFFHAFDHCISLKPLMYQGGQLEKPEEQKGTFENKNSIEM